MLRAFVEEPFDLVVGLAREQNIRRSLPQRILPVTALPHRADCFAMVPYFYCLRHSYSPLISLQFFIKLSKHPARPRINLSGQRLDPLPCRTEVTPCDFPQKELVERRGGNI